MFLLFLPSGLVGQTNTNAGDHLSLILVVGAPGQAEYETNFNAQAAAWRSACERAGYRHSFIGLQTALPNDSQAFRQTLANEPLSGLGQLWIVLIGHGTFDGKEAKFNLRGPDVSASELAEWLKPFTRPIALVNTAPSSAPFLNKLSATNRLIITATRSGHEQYHTRFGQYFAEAMSDLTADLDKDEQVSLLEAFLIASRRANEFYKINNRIATEHPLIDDNGDGLGTPAEWFRGLRATRKPKEQKAIDGLIARQFHLLPSAAEGNLTPEQRARRDQLERAVLEHREQKPAVPTLEYYRVLEDLLLELALFYETNSPVSSEPAEGRPSN